MTVHDWIILAVAFVAQLMAIMGGVLSINSRLARIETRVDFAEKHIDRLPFSTKAGGR